MSPIEFFLKHFFLTFVKTSFFYLILQCQYSQMLPAWKQETTCDSSLSSHSATIPVRFCSMFLTSVCCFFFLISSFPKVAELLRYRSRIVVHSAWLTKLYHLSGLCLDNREPLIIWKSIPNNITCNFLEHFGKENTPWTLVLPYVWNINQLFFMRHWQRNRWMDWFISLNSMQSNNCLKI